MLTIFVIFDIISSHYIINRKRGIFLMSPTSDLGNFEWTALVINEQRLVMASSKKSSIEILMEVFELFDESFNLNFIIEIGLYDCLNTLYKTYKRKPLEDTFKENYNTIYKLVHIFEAYKKEIRKFSVELYYALLDFMDYLKQKNMYLKILFS